MNAFRSRVRHSVRAAKRAIGLAQRRDEIEAADDRDAIARALAVCTPRQRAAVVLTEMLEFDSQDAGRMLGVKDVTVRVLASQGRAAMRNHMENDDE